MLDDLPGLVTEQTQRTQMSRAVAEALVNIGGARFQPEAPLTFKSGLRSPVYCDNRRFPFHPDAWRAVIEGFQSLIASDAIGFDVVGGLEAAGIPHSAALGYVMRVPSVFIRKAAKEHGTKKRVEGGRVDGRRVLLIEDLVTTGGSSLSGVEALRAEGALVTDCLAIISYGFAEARAAFEQAGVRLHTLTDFATVLDVVTSHGTLSPEAAAQVRSWLDEPHGWAARQGIRA